MLRAFGSASCEITHETRGAVCDGHWVLRLVISRDRGYDLSGALDSVTCDIFHETGGTISLRALGSAS